MEIKLEKRTTGVVALLDFSKDDNVSESYKELMKNKYKDILNLEVETR